ncbi:unnamed protein product [Ectocarpus sp. 4 AP-2014]
MDRKARKRQHAASTEEQLMKTTFFILSHKEAQPKTAKIWREAGEYFGQHFPRRAELAWGFQAGPEGQSSPRYTSARQWTASTQREISAHWKGRVVNRRSYIYTLLTHPRLAVKPNIACKRSSISPTRCFHDILRSSALTFTLLVARFGPFAIQSFGSIDLRLNFSFAC